MKLLYVFSFYGYDYLSFGNYDFLKGELSFNYRFYKKNYIKAIANIANANDNMFAERSWFSKPKYTGYALDLTFCGLFLHFVDWCSSQSTTSSPALSRDIILLNQPV